MNWESSVDMYTMHMCACSVTQSFQLFSLWSHRLQPASLLCSWNFPGKNIGVGCCFLLHIYTLPYAKWGFPGGSDRKRICLQCGRPGFDPCVRKIPWRRKGPPTPVFLPGRSHGQRSLTGYSPRGLQESDRSEGLTLYIKQTASGMLLYSTGRSAWCSGWPREQGRGGWEVGGP